MKTLDLSRRVFFTLNTLSNIQADKCGRWSRIKDGGWREWFGAHLGWGGGGDRRGTDVTVVVCLMPASVF